MTNFFSIVLPKVKENINLEKIEQEEIEEYMPRKLGVKVYLEFNDKNYIIAKVAFCYGEEEFNPLSETPNIPRSVLEEAESLNAFNMRGLFLQMMRKYIIFYQKI